MLLNAQRLLHCKVVLIGDGQATQNDFIVKPNVRKVRQIGEGVVTGFAGRAADGLTLVERLEAKLDAHPGEMCLPCHFCAGC